MSQQTSADAEQGCNRAAEPAADTPDSPRSESQTALECLARVAARHGVDLPAERLRHAYAVDGTPISQTLLLRMAKEARLRARTTRLDWGTLFRLGEAYPALVRLANGNWIIVSDGGEGPSGEEQVSVIDPPAERQYEPLVVGKDHFCANWLGEVILIKRNRGHSGTQQSFGFRWFIPELFREWRLFRDVAVAAILLYALGLALPIFFQLVIDKVLVHESFTTLYVLTGGAAGALTFDSIFNFLRRMQPTRSTFVSRPRRSAISSAFPSPFSSTFRRVCLSSICSRRPAFANS